MRRLLSILALALLTAAPASAALPAGDEFDGPLSGWTVTVGDLKDGVAPTYEVTGGELRIVPGISWWVDSTRAFYLWKRVAGDFVVTARLNVTGRESPLPTADWSLSGLLVRRPGDPRSNENWLSLRAGVVQGKPVFERKNTRNSVSSLVLAPYQPGFVELRIARVGRLFLLLTRQEGAKWMLQTWYAKSDLPEMLQAGVDAFSGYADTKSDLVSHVDWVHFQPTGVPRATRALVQRKLVPGLLLRYVTR